jgi:hypothetical protein
LSLAIILAGVAVSRNATRWLRHAAKARSRAARISGKRADGVCRFGLTQQRPVHATAEDLAELPSVEANISGIGAVDRGFDDDRGRSVPERVGPPSTRPRMYSARPAMSNDPCSIPILI